MKRLLPKLLSACVVFASYCAQAQTFSGTNAPTEGTNFAVSAGAGATNLSLVISNAASAYSYLLLKKGGAPTSDTDYDFIARLPGQTNAINLEIPEFVAMNYGLRVLTPATSATHAFNVVLTTNRSDLRAAAYPVLKPLVFSTTGFLTNSGSGAWQYFQVDVPTNLLTGWRVVLSTNQAGGNPNLYVRRGGLPTTGTFDKSSVSQSIDTVIFTSAEATNGTYFIGVYLPSGAASSANYTLSTELASVTTLAWDPGTTDLGTQVFTNASGTGGDYFFAITTLNTAVNVWRTALRVQSGEADVYLRQGSLPSSSSYFVASAQAGSDGFVLAQTYQFSPGQNWYLLVHATPGAQWSLVSGEAYVQPLPALAADASSGATATMGAEGMRFFKTTISTNTLAWELGLNGLTNQLYVKKTAAPHPYTSSATYDLTQPGQMLVVPTYLNVGDQYFVGVAGAPGLNFTLDSRQEAVTDLDFNSLTNFSVSGFGYTTFRVQVPIHQIAWQLVATPTAGDANVSVRRDAVPNEFVNNAFSEVPGSTADSVTLVPPTLSDGTFYVTVYGTSPYTCSLTNGSPIITDVNYVFNVTNDAPNRVGWRFYRVVNTAQQLGSLGWELDLTNQPPGTEIAIRRNAVPGRWNYRNSPYDSYSSTALGYEDVYTTSGFLQHPNHQADIWYVGVYSPATALNNFALTGFELSGPPVSLDGTGSAVINQPVGKFQYYTFTVPGDALGWDVRLTNVTAPGGAIPYVFICRDQLPALDNPYNWYPYYSSSWPSGYQWQAGYDWTQYYYNADATVNYGRILAMGMGNPLQPGTYYVGVISTAGSPISYTLLSRGIGGSHAIPVTPLAFTNGVITNPGLLAREAAYYSVVIPSNMPNWRVELSTNFGEALLMIEKDSLPNVDAGGYAPYNLYGGRRMDKTGNEQYFYMPQSGQTNVLAGTYYLAVASEGINPSGSTIGSGSSGFTLTSFGTVTATNIGTVDNTGVTDLIITNGASEAGQFATYQFSVPANTLGLEVHLENRVGNPIMMLRMGDQFPDGYDSYGNDGGQSYPWDDYNIINIANPVATNYTLSVQAIASGGNASYRVRVHALGPLPVAFDGGTWVATNQAVNAWQYFSITVPPDALGWDVRLTNVTAPGGAIPYVYVCRPTAPSLNNPNSWYPYYSTSWPSNYQWQADYDWTQYYYNPGGTVNYGRILAMGMGNPLQPGTYYVGVIATSGNPISYTLASRGIGASYTIPVTPLAFTNGVITHPGLPAREAAYYSVVVPSNMPNWRVEVSTNFGDAMLMLQKDALPNVDAGGYAPYNLDGGRRMQKAGNEQYFYMPASGQTNLVAGTYYLAVASEGMNPAGSTIGSNSCSFTLTSIGTVAATNIGTVDNTGVTDLIITNGLSEGGQFATYQFSVPANTLSLEVHLENRVGNPVMMLRTGDQLPDGYDGYGNDGGQSYPWHDFNLINIANPVGTNYTLSVQAVASGGDASYRVRVHALGPMPLAFDGGVATITNQAANVWQYFVINVPGGNADGGAPLGWDVRLTNVTALNNAFPYVYICRDTAPSLNNPNGWYPYYSASWPSGYQWQADYDWTQYYYNPDATVNYGRILQMGMGNPLQPGTYYVGVISTAGTSPISYTLVSRGVGPRFRIPVTTLAFTNDASTNLNLPPREAAYYQVDVPSNSPNWKVRVANLSGETMLTVQKDSLPNVSAGGYAPTSLDGGRRMQKAGNEQYLLLPASGQTNVPAGTYYLAVASEGMNPVNSTIGTNASAFTVTSYGVEAITNLGSVGVTDVLSTNAIEGGAHAFYGFTIPAGSAAVEVRLDNIAGVPYLTLQTGANIPNPNNAYGNDGGVNPAWSAASLITLPNPAATNYTLGVQASTASSIFYDANFTVHLRQMPTPVLNFAADLNTNGFSNVATGTLADNQRAFFQVMVPAMDNGQPVIGWKLDLAQTSGTPSVRVRPGLLPDEVSYDGTSPWATGEGIVAPPYLTPGVWYVEVRSTGSTTFSLTSSAVTTERPTWNMPVEGNPVTTPGLPPSGPLFGDSGISSGGERLGGDQGTDLAEGNFNFYSVTVPSGNIGILRTRLDAISGNPNLYIRVGAPPTLMHDPSGQSGTIYDRSSTVTSGSEYGNWVPINGRYEAYLTPGTWYLAVQAGGNANVRYRLRVFTGIVTDLSLNGGSFTNQTVAASDWLFYRVQIPTNSPVNWNVSFSQQLGNGVMYVRDRVPPGQGASTTDYRDWVDDNKNHGSYASYSPGSYTLNCPPLRPGNTYYLGVRAVNDLTFSIGCTTNAATIDYTNTVAFYSGTLITSIPAHGTQKLRIDVPPDGQRLMVNFTNASAFNLYLDQGSVPTMTTSDHWYSQSSANPSLNQPLYNATGWPWLPNYMYFLFVTNTTGTAQTLALGVDGRNCSTDDYDNDTLPDCWELTFFPSIYSYGPNDDPDGDGVRNLDEYLEGTVPNSPLSFHPRLQVTAQYGTVNTTPAGNATTTPPKVWFNLNQTIQLTAVPNTGYGFLHWSGSASGTNNPLSLLMDGHKNVTAVFALTNQPNADYRFQNNLHSSVGTPPDLTDIAAGNTFVTDLVDGTSQTVYRFPAGSAVQLAATNVIPTNIYTMVLLFRFDTLAGYRRVIDFKNPAVDAGLYQVSGNLNMYPVAAGNSVPILISNYVQVVLTRDASSNVVGYVNGVQQFSYIDTSGGAVLTGSPLRLRFFKDDASEDSQGAVARIRLYDQPMSAGQVAILDRTLSGVVSPVFDTPYFTPTLLNLPAHSLVPGLPYRLQFSTNLANWIDAVTNAPGGATFIFTRPLTPAYPGGYYRLINP